MMVQRISDIKFTEMEQQSILNANVWFIMKKCFFPLLALIVSSCATLKTVTQNYELECVSSCIIEENGYIVKRVILGDLPFSVRVKNLSKLGNMFRIKVTIVDDEEYGEVPYPSLYLVSGEGPKYKIEETLCIGNIGGDIDCEFNWDTKKDTLLIAIDAPGYHGSVYSLKPVRGSGLEANNP